MMNNKSLFDADVSHYNTSMILDDLNGREWLNDPEYALGEELIYEEDNMMNNKSLFDADVSHYNTFEKISSRKHKNEEDWKGFCKTDVIITKRKYNTSPNKFLLLRKWYDIEIASQKKDTDFYDDEGIFHPVETLEEFINRNKKYSEKYIGRRAYSFSN